MIRVEIVDYLAFRTDIHRIRFEVFVQEQQVPADLEIDRWESVAIHALAWADEKAIGTGRLLPDGHIGRVAICRPYRGQGIGRQIMESLIKVATHRGHDQVIISAQCHAIAFYERLDFQPQGDVYDEAGIDHIQMIRRLR